MSDKAEETGMSFAGLLTLIFITLKLLGVITWSWWWVLAPLWIGLPIAILFAVIGFFVVLWANK